MTSQPSAPLKSDGSTPRRPSVTIFGAGIAGLTAAHELVIRGFDVTVVEQEVSRYSRGIVQIETGGMARTQYAIGDLPDPDRQGDPRAPPDKPLPSRDMRPGEDADGTGLFPVDVEFDANQEGLGCRAMKALDAVAEWLSHRKESNDSISLHVPVLMPSGAPGSSVMVPQSQGGQLWLQRRLEAREYLVKHEQYPVPGERIHDGVPELASGIRVRVRCIMLPGEHGFRFFPAYYRHVFDTMSRIPIVDNAGAVTARAVVDNVQSAPYQAFAETGENPLIFPTSPVQNVSDWVQQMAKLLALGYTPGDIIQFLNRVLRYMATCPDRRAAEYEDISWVQYLRGYNPVTGTYLYTYSPKFTRDLDFCPRVLAAFDAQIGDARSCGGTYVQLLTSSLITQPRTNGTLNAPTTEAWFTPWRHFLEYRGVRFVQGTLDELLLEDGRLVARWGAQELLGERSSDDSDYVIIATDVVSAEKVSQRLPAIGVPGRLRGYTTRVPMSAGASQSLGPPRDPLRSQLGLVPWDRLQTITGIQFFYRVEFKLVEGYLYLNQAPWALSSVNSQQFWRRSPSNEQDGYVSVLSIDVGDWNALDTHGLSMWGATRDQIVASTLAQGANSLRRYQEGLPRPFWYHLDKNLVFDESTGKLIGNKTPFLIPVMGDWKNRPGANPWDPSIGASPAPRPAPNPPLAPGLWQADHGGYEVHWDRLVYAGTYLRTFTRMTTMESANESARHAVNAILDHCVRHQVKDLPPPPDSIEYAPEFVRSTAYGDYCRIWNPEENELPDMRPLKDLDSRLFAAGLPHVWDVLGLEALNGALVLPWQALNAWLWLKTSGKETERTPSSNGSAFGPPPSAAPGPSGPWAPPGGPGPMGGFPWMGMPMPGMPMPGMPMPGMPMPGMPMPGMPGMPQATWPGIPMPGMPGASAGMGGMGSPPASPGPEAFYQWLKLMRERLESALQQAPAGAGPFPPRGS